MSWDPAAAALTVVFEGSLKKKSPKAVLGRHVWQTRHFSLQPEALYYFKKKSDSKAGGKGPAGQILLSNMSTIKVLSTKGAGRFDILVRNTTRAYQFQAPDKDTRQRWVKAVISLVHKSNPKADVAALKPAESTKPAESKKDTPRVTHHPKAKRAGITSDGAHVQKTAVAATSESKLDPAVRAQLIEALSGLVAFKQIDAIVLKGMLENVSRVELKAGKTLIKENESSTACYVLLGGAIDVLQLDIDTDDMEVQKKITPGPQSVIGELNLLSQQESYYTYKATANCVLYKLEREAYRSVVIAIKQREFKTRLRFVENTSLLGRLPSQDTNNIADALESRRFANGENVVLQGEPGDCFYLVVSGRASAVIDGNEVKEYNSPGEFFGERSLIRDENRAATVTVVSEEGLEVLYLKREDFTALLGSNVDFTRMESEYRQAFSSVLQGITQGDAGAEGVDNSPSPADVGDAESPAKVHRPSIWSAAGSKVMEDFSAKRGSCRPSIWGETDGKGGASLLSSSAAAELTESSADEDEGLQGLSMGPVSERKEKGDKASSVVSKKVSDYEVVGTLGRGTFGHVQLVQDKQGHMYALKAINKQHIVDNEQVSHLKYERDVMLELGDFPFVVKLWGTMQDKNFVYLLLEPSQGGEVFSLLTDKGQLDKTTAQFYAASVILAFQYMHERDILYRDLKPENLLLDTNGYLRVTDFGFAKKTTERTYTFCGTPDYLSPEIVSNAGHGPGADWWTLGVFIFEMLTGQTPFFDDAGPSEMYNKILAREFSFPLFFDEDARDLINGLLDLKPTKRYGVLKEPNIREHKWFEGFDWDALIAGTMEAPFVRPVKSKFDLSHFDADSDDDDGFDEEFEADSDEEDPFIGF